LPDKPPTSTKNDASETSRLGHTSFQLSQLQKQTISDSYLEGGGAATTKGRRKPQPPRVSAGNHDLAGNDRDTAPEADLAFYQQKIEELERLILRLQEMLERAITKNESYSKEVKKQQLRISKLESALVDKTLRYEGLLKKMQAALAKNSRRGNGGNQPGTT